VRFPCFIQNSITLQRRITAGQPVKEPHVPSTLHSRQRHERTATESRQRTNNLANSSTSGFRRRRLQFTDLLYQSMIMPGSASTQQTTNAAGLQIGTRHQTRRLRSSANSRRLYSDGNPLDLAIQGQGFFQVQMPMDKLPTRAREHFISTRKETS